MEEVSSSIKRKRSEPENTEQMSSEEIIEIIEKIDDYKGSSKDKQRFFRKIYPDFVEKYPVLFEMSTQNDFDINRLKYMLSLRSKVEQSKLSQYDASAHVGQMLYDSYVKDKIIDTPPDKNI
uniref:Uncharacterized protein n=1 Tax=viral metagenome TaxID=1070528 RepID=A0A6C0CTB8_9ZZZZ